MSTKKKTMSSDRPASKSVDIFDKAMQGLQKSMMTALKNDDTAYNEEVVDNMSSLDINNDDEGVKEDVDDEEDNTNYPDILILPEQMNPDVYKWYNDGALINFGASKKPDAIYTKLQEVASAYEGDDPREVVYYLHKQLKHYCIPRDIFDNDKCNAVYDLGTKLEAKWNDPVDRTKDATVKTTKKATITKKTTKTTKKVVEKHVFTFDSEWHRENKIVYDAVSSFCSAMYQFDVYGLIKRKAGI